MIIFLAWVAVSFLFVDFIGVRSIYRPRLPHQNFLDVRKSLENSKKKIQIIENTRNIANIALIFRICGVKVSKIQVEREGGLDGRWTMPSNRRWRPATCLVGRLGPKNRSTTASSAIRRASSDSYSARRCWYRR
jgi:hypothetical protein